MDSVLIDNWLITNVVREYEYVEDNKTKEGISSTCGKLLTALILWDTVYYPCNFKSFQWERLDKHNIGSFLTPYDDYENLFQVESLELYEEYYRNTELSVVAVNALRYMMLSNFIECDYFPSYERSKFLKCYNYDIVEKLSRFDYINVLDDVINRYYEELNREFKHTFFKIDRPVLVDFIIQNTPINMSYFEFAMHLRLEGPVVQYRKYLSDIEKAIEKREWKVLNEMIQYSNEIVDKVLSLDRKSIGTLKISMLPIPSIEFSKSIKIHKKKIHLSFLEELSEFSFSGRKL